MHQAFHSGSKELSILNPNASDGGELQYSSFIIYNMSMCLVFSDTMFLKLNHEVEGHFVSGVNGTTVQEAMNLRGTAANRDWRSIKQKVEEIK